MPEAGPRLRVVFLNRQRRRRVSQARLRGARTLDGLGMLVYQGAIGFKLWTGLDAPVKVMRRPKGPILSLSV